MQSAPSRLVERPVPDLSILSRSSTSKNAGAAKDSTKPASGNGGEGEQIDAPRMLSNLMKRPIYTAVPKSKPEQQTPSKPSAFRNRGLIDRRQKIQLIYTISENATEGEASARLARGRLVALMSTEMLRKFKGESSRIKDLKRSFDVLDENGDGTIDRAQLEKALRFRYQNPSNEEMQSIMKEVEDGPIDFPEFLRVMSTDRKSTEAALQGVVRDAPDYPNLEMALVGGVKCLKDHYDPSTLEQILEMDEGEDDREFSKSILRDYFLQADETLRKFDQEFKAGDYRQLCSLADFLGGSAGTLGSIKVREGCLNIQDLLQNIQYEEQRSRMEDQEIEKVVRRLRTTIKKLRRDLLDSKRVIEDYINEYGAPLEAPSQMEGTSA